MRYIKNNVMLIFAIIIYGFLLFKKHREEPSRLIIYQVGVSLFYDSFNHLNLICSFQDSDVHEVDNSEPSNPVEPSDEKNYFLLNQQKEEEEFISKKVSVLNSMFAAAFTSEQRLSTAAFDQLEKGLTLLNYAFIQQISLFQEKQYNERKSRVKEYCNKMVGLFSLLKIN